MQRCFVTKLITGIYESTWTRRRAQVGVGRLVNLLVLRNRLEGRNTPLGENGDGESID